MPHITHAIPANDSTTTDNIKRLVTTIIDAPQLEKALLDLTEKKLPARQEQEIYMQS